MSDSPFFGTAGNADSFYDAGFKDVTQAPAYLHSIGLTAYEYQGGHGVRIPTEKARLLGKNAADNGVRLSVHSPYYISMTSTDEKKRAGSIDYILRSAQAAKDMGADRVVVHCGSCSKMSRGDALSVAAGMFKAAAMALDEHDLSCVHLCPETMGKINQLGTVDEVLKICETDERLIPCIDFGHVYARTFGGLTDISDFEKIFSGIKNRLGSDRFHAFHVHFSHIEYTMTGGEKCHLTFEDTHYGPEFEPVAELCAKFGCSPVFICESRGTQAKDALAMKKIYCEKAGKNI